MADTPGAEFLEKLERGHNENQVADRIPTILTGDLAAGTVIAASGSASEKVRVKGAYRLRVIVEGTGTTPNTDLLVSPYLADGSTVATVGTATVNVNAASTQFKADLDLYGAKDVEIKLTEAGGVNSFTITRVEVSML